MREILFRGKREDNGKWVEGASIIVFAKDKVYIPKKASRLDVIHDTHSNLTRIENTKMYKVDVSTIGQYTGLTDKNDTKIFEGDIIKDDWGKIYKVFYSLKSCSFMLECTKTPNEWEKGTTVSEKRGAKQSGSSATSTIIPSCWRVRNEIAL